MITKLTLLFTLLFIGFNSTFAQNNEECKDKLSLFHEYAKVENYDAAYEPWMYVRNNCPELNIAIYKYGEDILEAKIKQTQGIDKTGFINDLLKLWEQRAKYFPSKTKKGKYTAMACQLKYDNKKILRNTDSELYDCFNETFKADKATFTNPKSLYTYFSLIVDLYDNGEKSAQDLFNKYDDISEKIEVEIKNYSEKLNALIIKKDDGLVLTKKEKQYKKYYEKSLKSYNQISISMAGKSNIRSNCENLIPLYEKGFESHKSDAVWLKRAVNKMYHKGCTNVLLYENMVKAYDDTAPSADTKYFVATVLLKNGKEAEAESYLKQAFNLESDTYKKGKLAYKIGLILKNKGKFSQARIYFNRALKLNPSNGAPHLSIASMYNASAKNCGNSNFNKRAVYWLAAKEAQKASRVDPTLKKDAAQSAASYKAKAPTKQEIFIEGNSGETIKIECWIKSSIKVPVIK
ncbi:tetratricopeptide repeat protein [Flavivirga spongiicola]|uniref:Tetratricopeptide repeat protein n=1 Tax=Flavivirga spongiicola TaxID=421621 RepID=A0ABU7XYD4_9FLAO|nr:tetratricopeptide repeat protein [Flavivirga sp. MEBiC05379]MDO5979879.1 tetratricopeptide repeat protein [Flavivirga sp. MEBiC05379]